MLSRGMAEYYPLFQVPLRFKFGEYTMYGCRLYQTIYHHISCYQALSSSPSSSFIRLV